MDINWIQYVLVLATVLVSHSIFLLKIIFIDTFCVRDCDSSQYKEVCARLPNSDKQVVVKNRCLLDRQICYDTEFGCDTYTFLHDGGCKGWDGWTIEEVGEKPCFHRS